MARPALLLAGAALVVWSVLAERLRGPDGVFTAEIVLPLAAGIALALAGGAIGTRGARACAWLALTLLGQAAWLQLIAAGPFVRYQHFAVDRVGTDIGLVAVSIIGVQALLVAIALLSRARRLAIARTVESLSRPRVALAMLAVALLALFAAFPSRDLTAFAGELLIAAVVQCLGLASLVLAAYAMPREWEAWFDRWSDGWLSGAGTASRYRGPLLVAIAAAWVMLVAGLLSFLVYQRHPHVPDEVAYLMHARYLAEGWLTMPAPPVPEAFNLDLLQYETERWYSPVPPGWPLVLAVGVLARAPWLVNPVLAGVAVVLAYLLLRDVYGVRTARLATVLLAASPWMLFLSMSLMTHIATLVWALAAALAVARLRRTAQLRWAVAAGAALGLVGLTRPLEAVAMATLLGFWTLPVRGRRGRFLPVATLTVCTLLAGAAVLPYNAALTGDPTRFPINSYTDQHYGVGSNALGFGPDRGLGWSGLDPLPGHASADVAVNTHLNVVGVNIELFGWVTGSLVAILLLPLAGRLERPDWQMIAAIASIIGIHALYWFGGGPDFGPRYWFLIIVPCVALAARGIEALDERLREAAMERPRGRRALAAAAAVSLIALVVFVPWRATDKYFRYRGMRPDVRELARVYGFEGDLVLVRGRRHPDFASAAVYNPIDLRRPGATIFAWDHSAAVRADLLRVYSDRRVWVIDGPTVTGGGYAVVAGPMPAELVLAADEMAERSGAIPPSSSDAETP